MSDKENKQLQLLNNVQEFLTNDISNYNQNINNPKQGILLVPEINPFLNELKEILEPIDQQLIEVLPESRLNVLDQFLNKSIFKKLHELRNLEKNPGQTDAQQKTSFVHFFSQTNQPYQMNKETIRGLVMEGIVLRNNQLISEKGLEKNLQSLSNIQSEAYKIKEQLSSALSAAQEDLGKGGVHTHAVIFETAAKNHETASKKWFCRIVWLIAINALVVIGMYFFIMFGLDETKDMIEAGVLTALLVSLISYSIAQSTKSYYAEKHNEQINRHKANCLSTYNTFINAADYETKAAVLLYATQTIFSHQNTGFGDKEVQIQNPNPIVEVVSKIPKNPLEN